MIGDSRQPSHGPGGGGQFDTSAGKFVDPDQVKPPPAKKAEFATARKLLKELKSVLTRAKAEIED